MNTSRYKVKKIVVLLVLTLWTPMSSLNALAYTITIGQPVKINFWNQNVNNCSATNTYSTPLWTRSDALIQTPGSLVVPAGTFAIAGNYTFTYTCFSTIDFLSRPSWATLSVVAPPPLVRTDFVGSNNPFLTLSFSANKFDVPSKGTVTLTWNYSDAGGTCVSSGTGWSAGARASYGTVTISNSSGGGVWKTFTLNCTTGASTPITSTLNIYFQTVVAYVPPPCGSCIPK